MNSSQSALEAQSGRETIASEQRGYTAAMRAMHWFTVLLLTGSYTTALSVGSAGSGAELASSLMTHRSVGILILVLTAIRFFWRRGTRVPELPADMPTAQRLAARATAASLYGLLLLQPLLGLGASMLHGDGIVLTGGFVLPRLLPLDRRLSRVVFEIHGAIAILLLTLIVVHVLAALYHHLVRRDQVLTGMLPLLRRMPPAVAARGILPS